MPDPRDHQHRKKRYMKYVPQGKQTLVEIEFHNLSCRGKVAGKMSFGCSAFFGADLSAPTPALRLQSQGVIQAR